MNNLEAIKAWVEELEFQSQVAQIITMVNREEMVVFSYIKKMEEFIMKICPMSNQATNCTENCRNCAKEAYRDLKGMSGKAEYVSEEAIRNDLGDRAFELMREHGFIEYCTTIQGRKMYAI